MSLSIKKLNLSDTVGGFADVMLMLSLLIVGGFNEYVSCILSIAMLVYLFVKMRKERHLTVRVNLLSVSVAVMVLFYGLTIFWAVDSGMAFVGLLKFLPVLLYQCILHQQKQSGRVLHVLPYYVAALTVVSAIGSLIPGVNNLFLVAERFAGIFQYPNTFAILILVAELLLFKKAQWKIPDYVTAAILIGGLLYTASRAVFVLFLLSNFLMILTRFSGKQRLIILGIVVAAVAAVTCVALLGPEDNAFSRLMEIGLTQSTFVGRFLYMQDALSLLLKHPFGMGYFGYFFSQGEVQTGVYSVSFVHNDLLQIALDVGILPALLFLAAIVRYLFNKSVPFADKVIVAVFTLHNLFDFNLQFVGMFMLYLLLMQTDDGKEITVKRTDVLKAAMPLLAVVNLYMAIPFALSQFSAYEAAHTLYPYYTRNTLLLLEQQTDVNAANEIAEEILAYNTTYYAPYDVQAKYAYSLGDFLSVMRNKKEVFSRNRFGYNEYEDYAVMLTNGIVAYEQMGDSASADVLKKELRTLKNQLASLSHQVSPLGSLIDDKPVTQLPDEVLQYLDYSYGMGGDSH